MMSQPVDNLAFSVDNSSPERVWDACLDIIKETVNPQSFQTWFAPIIPIKLENRRLTIQVPSQFFYEWIEEYYPHIIRSSLTTVLGNGAVPVYDISQTAPVHRSLPSVNENIMKNNSGGMKHLLTDVILLIHLLKEAVTNSPKLLL